MPFPQDKLAAPFPWFGGKVMQSDLIWSRFGAVTNYVEPFAGSLGVLLNRPLPFKGVETINDLDAFVCNFWRSVQKHRAEVVDVADYPVSDLDMWARHDMLIARRPDVDAMLEDPEWCDPEVAGLWVWGLCQWIGSGWCAESSRKRSHTGNAGMGIQRATKQRSHTGDAGRGAGMDATYQRELIEEWMTMLEERIRRVRILHGDWSRAVQSGVLRWGKHCGVYLDPPYLYSAKRTAGLYAEDSATVADDVREWCLANGDNPRLRIALAGYDGEHEMPDSWECVVWNPHGKGYASQSSKGTQATKNVKRERVWFSPHCLTP